MDMDILFDTGDIVNHVQYNNFIKGNIKNPYINEMFGVSLRCRYENNRIYHTWYGILKRTLDDSFQEKHPTYKGCVLCKEWFDYNAFKNWYNATKYEIDEELEVDKDLKCIGNKIYSPEVCILLPKLINDSLGFVQYNKKSDLPIGVSKVCSKFQARIYKFNKSISLGYFNDSDEAFEVYKYNKILYWKELIDFYEGKLPNDIMELMKDYKIEERLKRDV